MSLPKTCKAAVITAWNEPIEVREVKMPERLEPKSMLVKIEAASICGTDVHMWEGYFESMGAKPPIIPGHEMVGRIVALGEGATHDFIGQELKLGDRILWAHVRCGQCYECRVTKVGQSCKNTIYYMAQNCEKYPYIMGGFAEYCYIHPKTGTVKVPDEIKDAWASAAGCALRSVVEGYNRLDKSGGMSWMDTVLVQGAGPLGLFVTAIAATKGVKEIIVIGAPDERLEVARQWGANRTISINEYPDANDRAKVVMEMTKGKGADILFEVSGATGAFAEGLGLLAMNGKYVVLGQMGGPKVPIAADIITKKNATIIGNFSADIDAYYTGLLFMQQNHKRFNFDLMFSNIYKLSEINVAMQRMQRFEEIKPLIIP